MADIEEIEKEITLAKADISKAKALTRLRLNKDFKEVISVGYLESRVIHLVHSKANRLTPEQDLQINKQLDAISFLIQYMKDIEIQGDSAEAYIGDSERLLDEIRGEVNE